MLILLPAFAASRATDLDDRKNTFKCCDKNVVALPALVPDLVLQPTKSFRPSLPRTYPTAPMVAFDAKLIVAGMLPRLLLPPVTYIFVPVRNRLKN